MPVLTRASAPVPRLLLLLYPLALLFRVERGHPQEHGTSEPRDEDEPNERTTGDLTHGRALPRRWCHVAAKLLSFSDKGKRNGLSTAEHVRISPNWDL